MARKPQQDVPAPATGGSNGSGPLLTVAQILAADDVHTERVHVPEWGGDVILSTPTAALRDRFERAYVDDNGQPRDTPHIRATIVATACVREDGQPMFEPKDIPALAAKSAAVIDRLAVKVMRLDPLAAQVEAARQD